jgi:hypothetical protein
MSCNIGSEKKSRRPQIWFGYAGANMTGCVPAHSGCPDCLPRNRCWGTLQEVTKWISNANAP